MYFKKIVCAVITHLFNKVDRFLVRMSRMGIAAHLVNCVVNSEKSYYLRQVFLEIRR